MTTTTFERDGILYETAELEYATRDEQELVTMIIDGARMCEDHYVLGWCVQNRIENDKALLDDLIDAALSVAFGGSGEDWDFRATLLTGYWTETTKSGRTMVLFKLNPEVAKSIRRYAEGKDGIWWDDLTVAIVNDTRTNEEA